MKKIIFTICIIFTGVVIAEENRQENQNPFTEGLQSINSDMIWLAVTKAESTVWAGFQPWRGKTKSNGLTGKKKRYYEWDFTHDDIEVYDSKGNHLGSMDAETGEMSKPPVSGRKIEL